MLFAFQATKTVEGEKTMLEDKPNWTERNLKQIETQSQPINNKEIKYLGNLSNT